jgi:hypothetical protein
VVLNSQRDCTVDQEFRHGCDNGLVAEAARTTIKPIARSKIHKSAPIAVAATAYDRGPLSIVPTPSSRRGRRLSLGGLERGAQLGAGGDPELGEQLMQMRATGSYGDAGDVYVNGNRT